MRLYINEKLMTLHNKYYINDENGNNVLEISSKLISLGDKTWIKNLDGKELVYIEQELFHLMPKYNVYINGQLAYSINKKFHILKNDYIISNNYRVEGSFLSHNFSVYNEKNEKIGDIYRKYLTIGDKYIIDINDEKEYLTILSIIVAITNDIDRAQRAASASSSN